MTEVAIRKACPNHVRWCAAATTPSRQRHCDGHDDCHGRQPQRDGQAPAHDGEHRLPGANRDAGVASGQAGGVPTELLDQRTIEPQQLAVLDRVLQRGRLAEEDRGRVAGDQAEQHERDNHDEQGDEDRLNEAPQHGMSHQAQGPFPKAGERTGAAPHFRPYGHRVSPVPPIEDCAAVHSPHPWKRRTLGVEAGRPSTRQRPRLSGRRARLPTSGGGRRGRVTPDPDVVTTSIAVVRRNRPAPPI